MVIDFVMFFFESYQDRLEILETVEMKNLKETDRQNNQTLQLLVQTDLHYQATFQNWDTKHAQDHQSLRDLEKEILPNQIW